MHSRVLFYCFSFCKGNKILEFMFCIIFSCLVFPRVYKYLVYILNNKINFTSEINSIKNQNVSSLQNAINAKKQELFQSFNNPNMLDSNTTVASKIIFNNKFSDVHNQEQKVSLKEAMNINKKRELF